jgi:hypothetical protein
MQTAPPLSFAPTPAAPMATPYLSLNPPETVRASVGQLLSRAYSLPCSTAANAFNQLVQPNSRFQLALDALLPLLDMSSSDVCQRILVSFILYSIYAPHPITINPFKSVLFVTYAKERQQVLTVASNGGVSPNEQLVWVLWKILSGDGDDIGPYSPSTLARSPLPDQLRASILVLDDRKYLGDTDDSHDAHSEQAASATKSEPKPTSTSSLSQDHQNESIAKGMQLLLEARERVLTLAEQRVLSPLLTELASSHMLTSLDLAPIIAHNTTLAHPLFVALLLAPPPAPSASEFDDDDFPSISSYSGNIPVPFSTATYLQVLTSLPPTLPTFDLLGRLLRDNTEIGVTKENGAKLSVSALVKAEVLGRFVSASVDWLDRAERDEREGRVSDDRFIKGVQNFCRFYHSLIKLSIVDTSSDVQCAEMKHFSLRHSRFEEANGLYRVLARGGF